jgi:hypothetical protein
VEGKLLQKKAASKHVGGAPGPWKPISYALKSTCLWCFGIGVSLHHSNHASLLGSHYCCPSQIRVPIPPQMRIISIQMKKFRAFSIYSILGVRFQNLLSTEMGRTSRPMTCPPWMCMSRLRSGIWKNADSDPAAQVKTMTSLL